MGERGAQERRTTVLMRVGRRGAGRRASHGYRTPAHNSEGLCPRMQCWALGWGFCCCPRPVSYDPPVAMSGSAALL